MGRRNKFPYVGLFFLFVGLGLIFALMIPAKHLVVVLSIALAISGIAICKQ